MRTEGSCLSQPGATFPAVSQRHLKVEYAVYYSTSVGSTVAAIIAYVEAHADKLIDLRIERPSLEDRFLEITTSGGAR